MRRSVRLTRWTSLGLALALVPMIAGCAEPRYRFVGSRDRDLVLRVPRDWAALNTAAAVKATGVEPSSNSVWTAFYDASPKPGVRHVQATSTDEPFLYAQSIRVGAEQRAGLTDAQLLELMLPATPEVREVAIKAKDFAVLSTKKVSGRRQHGYHVRYSFKLDAEKEFYDRIALTDPKRTTVYIVFVHCTETCFRSHPEIDDVVASLTLKPR